MKKVYIELVVAICLLFSATATAINTYRGVEITELINSMDDHRIIAITGDSTNDHYLFAVTFPQWLADSRDAARENVSTREIYLDNRTTKFANLYTEDSSSGFYRYYKRHADYIRGDKSDRALEVGFCKDPFRPTVGYFYCFGYSGVIYRVIDSVDYLDIPNKRIDRAWQYIPYDIGEFKQYSQPGPYGIYPTPKIAGLGDEPKIFID